MKTSIAMTAVLLAGALTALTAAADDKHSTHGVTSDHHIVPADQLTWGDAPPAFPKGAKMAVLQGDPSVPGELVTVRLKMPKGYTIPPHFHPTDEAVTVVSGAFLMGMGDKIDRKTATALKPGGWGLMPKNEHHYAVATAPTVVQVHFMGPFAITYVNEKDDPQKSAAK